MKVWVKGIGVPSTVGSDVGSCVGSGVVVGVAVGSAPNRPPDEPNSCEPAKRRMTTAAVAGGPGAARHTTLG